MRWNKVWANVKEVSRTSNKLIHPRHVFVLLLFLNYFPWLSPNTSQRRIGMKKDNRPCWLDWLLLVILGTVRPRVRVWILGTVGPQSWVFGTAASLGFIPSSVCSFRLRSCTHSHGSFVYSLTFLIMNKRNRVECVSEEKCVLAPIISFHSCSSSFQSWWFTYVDLQ